MRLPSFRQPILLLCAAALVSGCYSTRRYALPAAGDSTTIAAGKPVLVKLADGSAITLASVHVMGDSLVGLTEDAPPRRVALATAAVRDVEERQLSKGRTAAAAAAGTLTTLFVLAGVVVAVALSAL